MALFEIVMTDDCGMSRVLTDDRPLLGRPVGHRRTHHRYEDRGTYAALSQ